jgi:DNA repair protein RadC
MDYAKCSNVELLSIVIGTRDAKRIYQGTLAPLFVADIGSSLYNRALIAAKELVQRSLAEELERGNALCAPETVREYLRLMFAGEEREVFIALFLDTQHRLIVAEKLFFGTLSQTAVYPREVVKRALQLNAASMIFAHNHPSGVCEPSMADTCLTQELKKALALVDVKVLDHFVVAGNATMSFAERGMF